MDNLQLKSSSGQCLRIKSWIAGTYWAAIVKQGILFASSLDSRLTKSWVELFVDNADLTFIKIAYFGVILHTEL